MADSTSSQIPQSTGTTAMSKEQQNQLQHPSLLGTTKLNQATPSTIGSASETTPNVIQTNNKNTILSNFVSVIEGTKDLSISDEKQRSPKHQHHTQRKGGSKTVISGQPKQHPLLENTNLNSCEAKLPAAPTVITPQPSASSMISGNDMAY